MGTHWSPHDSKAQERYRRGKAKAEMSAAKADSESEGSAIFTSGRALIKETSDGTKVE